MGDNACNGWKFWSIAEAATKKNKPDPAAKPGTERIPGSGDD